MRPESGTIRWFMHCSNVLLPPPEGPISTLCWPVMRSSDTARSTSLPLKALDTASTRRMGEFAMDLFPGRFA